MKQITIHQIDALIEARAILTAAIFGAIATIDENEPSEEEARISFGLSVAFRAFMDKMDPILGTQLFVKGGFA